MGPKQLSLLAIRHEGVGWSASRPSPTMGAAMIHEASLDDSVLIVNILA
jgi:hypothetical protein